MQITFEDRTGQFIALSTFEERSIPKSAGFQWDGGARRWTTRSAEKAARLEKYADAKAKQRLLEMSGPAGTDQPKSGASLSWSADRSRYEWRADKEMNQLPKEAGFKWDPDLVVWHSADPAAANKLATYGDDATKARLGQAVEARQQAIEASRQASADADLPVPEGLKYLPYQTAGILAALHRPNTYFGDEMGLGKTIQAIGTFNADPEAKTMLVIAPASLKINWQRELEKWSTKPVKVGIADGKKFPDDTHNVVVINYENVKKHRQTIDARRWDVMVCDESHYLKNDKAQRTKAILGGYDKATRTRDPGIRSRRTIMMTGTPIPNRPKELWTTVQRLDPDGLGQSFMGFAKRYCGAQQDRYGWNFDGASNLSELQDKLRASIMIRRTKKDVLTELPPKIRQVIPLEADRSTQKIIEKQNKVAAGIDTRKAEIARLRGEGGVGFEDEVAKLQDQSTADFTEMSRLRHEIAVAKIPAVIDHIKESLDSGSAKIIVFAHHKDVVKAIKNEFGREAVSITGETPNDQRQAAVDRFQSDPACRVFVGNIRAAGVGLTLTASSHVVMAELDWTPGNVSQAEDRAHRIGATDTVLVQHLVFDGSLDARLAQVMVEKQDVADRALDRRNPEAERAEQARIAALIERTETAAASRTPEEDQRIRESIMSAEQVSAVMVAKREERDRLEAEASTKITPEQIAQVQQNLHSLENVCDYAQERDGSGFNAADANFGHYLAGRAEISAAQALEARTMLVKYKKQLGDDAVQAMFGRGQTVQADGPAADLATLERQTGLDPAKATPLPAKRRAAEQGVEL